MDQIKDTLQHEVVCNVAIKELLKTGDREPRKHFQEQTSIIYSRSSHSRGPTSIFPMQASLQSCDPNYFPLSLRNHQLFLLHYSL